MRSRRHFIRLSSLALIAPAVLPALDRAEAQSFDQVYLPLAFTAQPALPAEVPPDDMPLLGPPSGAVAQAISWVSARCAGEYTAYDVTSIVDSYRRLGEWVALDWFLAIAQMAHETGHMTSWWSGRPRRNPAGISVTGRVENGAPDEPPGPGWTWDGKLWREGWSFPSWDGHAIPAHLGRLLAYALTDAQANPQQRSMIDYALSFRPLPASYRGVAPTIVGLNGKWAVPGTTYGQRIIDLLWRMRQG